MPRVTKPHASHRSPLCVAYETAAAFALHAPASLLRRMEGVYAALADLDEMRGRENGNAAALAAVRAEIVRRRAEAARRRVA